MSNWTNPEKWQQLLDAQSCPICHKDRSEYLIELTASFLVSGEDAALKGYCTLFAKKHVIELYELSVEEGAAFMHDIQRVARAIHQTTGAVKLNYEIHGNTIPHLHMHFFPRYQGDPYEWQPINPRVVNNPVYAPGEFTEFVKKLQQDLQSQ